MMIKAKIFIVIMVPRKFIKLAVLTKRNLKNPFYVYIFTIFNTQNGYFEIKL